MDAAKLDSVEFWMETPLFWLNGAHIEELLAERKKYPQLFPLAMHAPIFDLNPCSFNEGVAKLTAEYSIACIDMLSALGGGIITVHPGKRTAKRPVSHLDMERFQTYVERLEKHAGNNVQIALENMPYAINAHMITPEEMRRVLDEYSWLYFTFDYAHALQAESVGKIDNALSFVDLCGDRLVNIHASMGGSAEKMHTPLRGTAEGNRLIQNLLSAGYSGRITFEFEDLNIGNLKREERISLLATEATYFRSAVSSK
ncbi:MAG TPA: TIM barrel protein [Methanocorpusculum sp.]|nr:TIM barrel protein [Methanocorpusculum sp.]